MPISCFNCDATSNLHSLPQKHKSLQKKWLDIIPNIEGRNFNKNFYLCSAHFDKKCITKSGRLFWNAVPSIFLVDGSWITITELNRIEDTEKAEQVIVTDHFNISTSGDLYVTPTGIVTSTNENDEIIMHTKEFRSVTDIDINALYSPKSARRALALFKVEYLTKCKRIHSLYQQLARAKQKIKDMDKFLDRLEVDGIIKNRPSTLNDNLNI